MVGEGVREEQIRTEDDEGCCHRGGRQTTTPMDFQTVTNAVTVRSTRTTGLDTLTTFSANRPQTVTFDGPISRRTASGPPRNMATTVSRGGRVISDPLCVLGGSAQPPELSAPLEHRPNGYEQRPRILPEQQACGNWVPPWSMLREGMAQTHPTSCTSHCEGVGNNPQYNASGTHQREGVCQPGGVSQNRGQGLPPEEVGHVQRLRHCFADTAVA